QATAGRAGRAQSQLDRGDRKPALEEPAQERADRRSLRPAQAAVFDLDQDGAQVGRLRAIVRYLRVSSGRGRRRILLPCARYRAYDLAGGAGPLQGLHLDAETE